MGTKFADITDPATMFDRAAELSLRPRKALKHHDGTKFAEFELKAAHVGLHPELPDTPVWAYDGLVPGPVVVVDSGDHVHMRVENRIGSKLPFEHVVVSDESAGTGTMNEPGTDFASTADADQSERDSAADLTACCVMHLHGAPTPPDSDGWAESVITHRETAHHHYQFRQETFGAPAWGGHPAFVRKGGAGPMFWYHDHAMGPPGSTTTPGSRARGSSATRSNTGSACRPTSGTNCRSSSRIVTSKRATEKPGET